MEDKKLNEKESLELITQMIQNTRRNLDTGSGNMFLLWGYVLVVITLIVAVGIYCTNNYAWMWGFWGIPVIGYPLSYLLMRKQRKSVKVYSDKVIGEIWKFIGACCLIIVLMAMNYSMMYLILPLCGMIMSLGTFITGIVIRYVKFSFSGAGFAVSIGILTNSIKGNFDIRELIAFALVVTFAMIVPGHILNNRARKDLQDSNKC